jgi:hypothetical protein
MLPPGRQTCFNLTYSHVRQVLVIRTLCISAVFERSGPFQTVSICCRLDLDTRASTQWVQIDRNLYIEVSFDVARPAGNDHVDVEFNLVTKPPAKALLMQGPILLNRRSTCDRLTALIANAHIMYSKAFRLTQASITSFSNMQQQRAEAFPNAILMVVSAYHGTLC